jgi:hypothetical protein
LNNSEEVIASRNGHYAENIVFVDGLWGCGKTMLSPIVASLDRVELLSFSYEIEHLCAMSYLERISMDASTTLIRMYSDLKLYNCMMGRDVNFRPTDLSSAINDVNPGRYFQRLFEKGDEHIPEKISKEKPILHIASHNLVPFAGPIFNALENRVKFLEVVRHPLFMIKQQALNMKNLIGGARDFTVYFTWNGKELPYYVRGWEREYLEATDVEKAILYQKHLTALSQKSYKNSDKILVIPFEKFVLRPESYMAAIHKLLETSSNDSTVKMLLKQKVPRENVVSGIDLEIYRRCGWTPPSDGVTVKGELDIRYEYVKNNVRPEYLAMMDDLISAYERDYWCPEVKDD